MEVSKEEFSLAASTAGIPKEQSEALWANLEQQKHSGVSPFSKLLFYFGAMIVIFAMTWLMDVSWEWFGSGGIFLISLAYAALFIWLGNRLWDKKDLRIPAGLLITMAVCMTPLAVFGLQNYLGLWPEYKPEHYKDFFYTIQGNWVFIELATILTGLIALKFFPFPFLTAPIFFAAWFLTLDSVPLLLGEDSTWEQKEWLTLGFGFVLLLIAYFVDRQKKREYGFWAYLFGTLAFWGALTAICWDRNEFGFFFYFVMNLLFMFLSILLQRKVFIVLGAIGVLIYLSHLAFEIFGDSLLFPFALSFIGLIIIYFGILYQKNMAWIERRVFENIPSSIKSSFPDYKS